MASVHERSDLAADVMNQALRATPAVAVATPAFLGVDLNATVLTLTGVYILLQIGFLLHRWWRMSRRPNVAGDE